MDHIQDVLNVWNCSVWWNWYFDGDYLFGEVDDVYDVDNAHEDDEHGDVDNIGDYVTDDDDDVGVFVLGKGFIKQ